MLVTTDLFVKNARFQVPSLLVQLVWGLPRNTAYPGYSNNNGPNLDENWPKARFQSHWEESPREKGQVMTAQPTCDPAESGGEEHRYRGGAGLQQLQTHTPAADERKEAGADLGGGKPRALTAGRASLPELTQKQVERVHSYFIYCSLENNCFPFPFERIPIKMRPLWLFFFFFFLFTSRVSFAGKVRAPSQRIFIFNLVFFALEITPFTVVFNGMKTILNNKGYFLALFL